MNFEWDNNKSKSNFEKHGINFNEACEISKYPRLTVRDDRFNYGEQREISIGKISEDIIIVIVYTKRHGNLRLISARKANARERNRYNDYIQTKT